MQAAAALQPIRFQFANSSPRLLSLPVDEIATSRKAHASISAGDLSTRSDRPKRPKGRQQEHPEQQFSPIPRQFLYPARFSRFCHGTAFRPASFMCRTLSTAKSNCGLDALIGSAR